MKFSPKLKIGIIIFLTITLFIILNYFLIAKEIKNFFYLVSQPFQKVLWKRGDEISDFLGMVFEIKNLKKENEELKLKVLELLSENIEKKQLEKENKALREALEIGLEKEFKLEIAELIGKDISQDFILINKGQRDGVSKDLPVITQQKILVGSISEVYKNFSKVALLSNKESSLDVRVFEKQVEGVVKGKGNFRLSLEFIPKEKEISKGDLIVTTSLTRLYPQGLLVGQIKEVKKQDIEPFQTAEVLPSFQIGEAEILFIIIEF